MIADKDKYQSRSKPRQHLGKASPVKTARILNRRPGEILMQYSPTKTFEHKQKLFSPPETRSIFDQTHDTPASRRTDATYNQSANLARYNQELFSKPQTNYNSKFEELSVQNLGTNFNTRTQETGEENLADDDINEKKAYSINKIDQIKLRNMKTTIIQQEPSPRKIRTSYIAQSPSPQKSFIRSPNETYQYLAKLPQRRQNSFMTPQKGASQQNKRFMQIKMQSILRTQSQQKTSRMTPSRERQSNSKLRTMSRFEERKLQRLESIEKMFANVIGRDLMHHTLNFAGLDIDDMDDYRRETREHNRTKERNQWNEQYSPPVKKTKSFLNIRSPFGRDDLIDKVSSSSNLMKNRMASTSRERFWRDQMSTNIQLMSSFKMADKEEQEQSFVLSSRKNNVERNKSQIDLNRTREELSGSRGNQLTPRKMISTRRLYQFHNDPPY